VLSVYAFSISSFLGEGRKRQGAWVAAPCRKRKKGNYAATQLIGRQRWEL
jgi:hypothetical protein